MPVYEFRCRSCGDVFSQFFRSREVLAVPACPACGSEAERKISASVHVRGEAARLDQMDTNRLLGAAGGRGDLPSEREFANWAGKMHETFGDTLGQDFRGMAEKAEAGENPIERLGVEHTLRYNMEKRKSELRGGDSSASAAESTSGQ